MTEAPRRVLVTGSRDWTDQSVIFRALYYERLTAGDRGMVIVHGDCPTGADRFADQWGRRFYPGAVTVETHPADWKLGKHAGHMRNQKMADLGADVCLAFPFTHSRGTRDCMERARAAGIEVREFWGHPVLLETTQ